MTNLPLSIMISVSVVVVVVVFFFDNIVLVPNVSNMF